jgi:butyryl-CoA dehydrogenase
MMLSEEQRMLREMVRDFAVNRIRPTAAETDENERFPEAIITEMAELGLLGIPYPEQYGGAGMDWMSSALAVEEIAKVCGSTAYTLAAHLALGIGPIFLFGTEEQKHAYLPDLCGGAALGALAVTERDAGSDVGAIRTTALVRGDGFILNGVKAYCTNGSRARVFTVGAVTDEGSGGRGLSCFIVDKGWNGVEIGRKGRQLGVRGAETVEVRLNSVRVPRQNLLGRRNDGRSQILAVRSLHRITLAAMALGLAEGAYDLTFTYVKERKAFDQRIVDFQATQFKLADMHLDIEAARHLVCDAARKQDSGEPFVHEAVLAKLFASEVARRVTSQAIQLHGGYGYVREYAVERFFRDAKVCELDGGTSEILRVAIAQSLVQDSSD